MIEQLGISLILVVMFINIPIYVILFKVLFDDLEGFLYSISFSVDVNEDVALLCSVLFEFYLLFFRFPGIEVHGFNRSPVSCCSRPTPW